MEWISVEDRFPEIGQRVLCFRDIESKQMYATIWNEQELKWADWNAITHWMPLPEPPK